MNKNILDLIEALKESKTPQVEYGRVLMLCTLAFKSLSQENNDLITLNNSDNYELYDSYIDLVEFMKSSNNYINKSLNYLDDEYKNDEIVSQLQKLQNTNHELSLQYKQKSEQHRKILKVKKEIDTISPQIDALQKKINLYSSLDLEKIKQEKHQLESAIETTYKEHKHIVNSIEDLTKTKESVSSDKSLDIDKLTNVVNELEKIMEIDLEDKKQRVEKSSKNLKVQIDKFENLQKQIEENRQQIEIYTLHFNENSQINIAIENEKNSQLLNEINNKLKKSDELLKESVEMEKKIRNDIEKRKSL